MKKITPDMHDLSYKSYDKCEIYKQKLLMAKSYGYFTPPYDISDEGYKSLVCQDDCIYPTCPFYSLRNLMERRHNHRGDYDEWIVDGYKKRLKEEDDFDWDSFLENPIGSQTSHSSTLGGDNDLPF